MSSTIDVKSIVVTLDCPDALALATFYANMLGWRVDYDEQDLEWVDVLPPTDAPQHFAISCQQIDHYRAPEWPAGDVPQQLHFDLYVDSVEQAVIAAEAAGARRHEHQPSDDGSFVVLVDPVGHPFCLCQT